MLAPKLEVTLDDGRKSNLPAILVGKLTALQVMFTGCSATCPIQGALFASVQERLAGNKIARLVSVTIDPLNDDPKAMRAWLQRFGAGPQWTGVTPRPEDTDRWLEFLRARSAGVDAHTAQVYFFNSKGELALRSIDFPTATEVAGLLSAMKGSI